MTDVEEIRIKNYIDYFENIIAMLEKDITDMQEYEEKDSAMMFHTQGQIYMLKKVCSKLHDDIIPF